MKPQKPNKGGDLTERNPKSANRRFYVAKTKKIFYNKKKMKKGEVAE